LEIDEYEAVKYWMSSLPGRDGTGTTKYHWKKQLAEFCKWVGKTPDDLIRERKEDLASTDDKVRHRAELKLKEFIRVLEDQGKAPSTQRNYFMAVRNFYMRNYAELKFFRQDSPRVETVSEGAIAATKSDIRRMVEVSNLQCCRISLTAWQFFHPLTM
jgi:hypothetical protein